MKIITTRETCKYWVHVPIGSHIDLKDKKEANKAVKNGWAVKYPDKTYILRGSTNGMINIPKEWFKNLGWKINDEIILTKSEFLGNHRCFELLITQTKDYAEMSKRGDFNDVKLIKH